MDLGNEFARLLTESAWWFGPDQSFPLEDDGGKEITLPALDIDYCREHEEKLGHARARRRNLKKEKKGGFKAYPYKRYCSCDFACKNFSESKIARDERRDMVSQLSEYDDNDEYFEPDCDEYDDNNEYFGSDCDEYDDNNEYFGSDCDYYDDAGYSLYDSGYAAGYKKGYAQAVSEVMATILEKFGSKEV